MRYNFREELVNDFTQISEVENWNIGTYWISYSQSILEALLKDLLRGNLFVLTYPAIRVATCFGQNYPPPYHPIPKAVFYLQPKTLCVAERWQEWPPGRQVLKSSRKVASPRD